jgi:hypothetical protein
MTLDLSTAAGALRFAELRREEMTRCFERLGRFEANSYSVCGYVFATHDLAGVDETGPKLPRVQARLCELPRAVHVLIPGENQSALFGEWVRAIAKVTRAVGVLTMAEVWSVVATEEERAAMPARLAHVPSRGEALRMFLDHSATGHRHWSANIQRNPTRLAAWVERGGAPLGGHLVGLAQTKN